MLDASARPQPSRGYLEEVVEHLTKIMRVVDLTGPTHVYVDGSHMKRNGPKGNEVVYGEGGGRYRSRTSS